MAGKRSSVPRQLLQLDVRVRIDKARHDRHVAKIQVTTAPLRLTYPRDSALLDRQAAVTDRWSFHRVEKA